VQEDQVDEIYQLLIQFFSMIKNLNHNSSINIQKGNFMRRVYFRQILALLATVILYCGHYQSTYASSGGGGNGGSELEARLNVERLEFLKKVANIQDFFKKYPEELKKEFSEIKDFENFTETLDEDRFELSIVDERLVDKYGIARTCVNYPEKRYIICDYQSLQKLHEDWSAYYVQVLHEFLGLQGIEKTTPTESLDIKGYKTSSKIAQYVSRSNEYVLQIKDEKQFDKKTNSNMQVNKDSYYYKRDIFCERSNADWLDCKDADVNRMIGKTELMLINNFFFNNNHEVIGDAQGVSLGYYLSFGNKGLLTSMGIGLKVDVASAHMKSDRPTKKRESFIALKLQPIFPLLSFWGVTGVTLGNSSGQISLRPEYGISRLGSESEWMWHYGGSLDIDIVPSNIFFRSLFEDVKFSVSYTTTNAYTAIIPKDSFNLSDEEKNKIPFQRAGNLMLGAGFSF